MEGSIFAQFQASQAEENKHISVMSDFLFVIVTVDCNSLKGF